MIETGDFVFIFIGLVGGALVVWLWQRGVTARLLAECKAQRENFEKAQTERDEARKKVEELNNQVHEERDERIRLETKMQEQGLVVTPSTLIALAKAIAFGWRQEKVAENAQKVAELGRDLYKRLAALGGPRGWSWEKFGKCSEAVQ